MLLMLLTNAEKAHEKRALVITNIRQTWERKFEDLKNKYSSTASSSGGKISISRRRNCKNRETAAFTYYADAGNFPDRTQALTLNSFVHQ